MHSRRPHLFALSALLLAPVALSAGSILLSADAFTVLAGSAVTSTGAAGTVISNGDVGLSPTATSAITGFPPAVIVNGTVIATGAVTTQARADLITAATALKAMTPDTDLTGLDLGGMTLSSGVYNFDTAAGLTGALILDAQGQNNAFWVFQIGTSLSASVNSTVTFINVGSNGGADLGLFWNAGTEITVGADSDIAGNYISGTSITLGTGTSGGSRALALASVSLDQNQLDAFGGPGGGDLTGGLAYDLGGAIVAIPEPAALLWLAPLCALGFAAFRRAPRRAGAVSGSGGSRGSR